MEVSYSPFTGYFMISSRRDTVPLKNYIRILESVKNIKSYINDEKVERAIIALLSKKNTPKPPPTKGLRNAISDTTREYLQARRDMYFSETADDIKEAAKLLKEGEFNVSIKQISLF